MIPDTICVNTINSKDIYNGHSYSCARDYPGALPGQYKWKVSQGINAIFASFVLTAEYIVHTTLSTVFFGKKYSYLLIDHFAAHNNNLRYSQHFAGSLAGTIIV